MRWAILLVLALCAPAFAGEVSESITNKNVAGTGLYYWGGSHWERWTGDAGGPGIKILNGPETLLYEHLSCVSQKLIPGNSDSSASYPWAGANHTYILGTITDSSATSASLWAISVRRHLSTSVDSLSVWPTVTISPVTAAAAGNGIWTGAGDTLWTLGTATTAPNLANFPGEYLIAMPAGQAGAAYRKFSFEVLDRRGLPVTGAFISVKARLVAVYGTSRASYSGNSSIVLHLQGTR